MKKLNLDQIWKLCLSMWRWIAKEIERGSTIPVATLKEIWLKENTQDKLINDCYFCDWNGELIPGRKLLCNCPAGLVDKKFDCMGTKYGYDTNPLAFYEKLVSLNRKRLAKKKI